MLHKMEECSVPAWATANEAELLVAATPEGVRWAGQQIDMARMAQAKEKAISTFMGAFERDTREAR